MKRGHVFLAGVAFALLGVLILLLTLNGVAQLARLNGELRTAVRNHDRRISLINHIQKDSHLRTDTLLRMALTHDPLKRDKLFALVDHAGDLAGEGLRRLQTLGFSAQEAANFNAQATIVRNSQGVQTQITDLLASGHDAAARKLIRQQAIPLQAQLDDQLAQLRDFYEAADHEALAHEEGNYRASMRRTVILGSSALLLAGFAGWFSLYKLTQTYRDIGSHLDELERSRAALREEATHDALTGLANRRLFYDRLQQALHRARRHQMRLAVLYLDLDRFKDINDTHGHDVGDAVLTEVARRLLRCVRESDTVARIGGDEFTILLEEVADHAAVTAALRKISQALAEGADFYGLPIALEASIGHALFPDDGASEDALLRAADQSMYRAKHRATSPLQRPLFPL